MCYRNNFRETFIEMQGYKKKLEEKNYDYVKQATKKYFSLGWSTINTVYEYFNHLSGKFYNYSYYCHYRTIICLNLEIRLKKYYFFYHFSLKKVK
jgi:hypothetical protein